MGKHTKEPNEPNARQEAHEEKEARHSRLEAAFQSWQRIGKDSWGSQKACAEHFNISKSSLGRRIKEGVPAQSPKPEPLSPESTKLLTDVEQDRLVDHLVGIFELGFPATLGTVVRTATEFLGLVKRPLSTVDRKWAQRLLAREPRLHMYEMAMQSSSSSKQLDHDSKQAWFTRLEGVWKKHDIPTSNIWSMAEFSFLLRRTPAEEVVMERAHASGLRASGPSSSMPDPTEWVTTIQSISADGYRSGPYILLEDRPHSPSITANYHQAFDRQDEAMAAFATSGSELMDAEVAVRWLKHWSRVTLPPRNEDGTLPHRVLIVDDHPSHCSIKFLQLAFRRNVIVLCLPPNSARLLQPLDAGCFETMKSSYILSAVEDPDVPLDHNAFIQLYAEVWKEVFSRDLVISAFEKTGIVPFDPDRVGHVEGKASTKGSSSLMGRSTANIGVKPGNSIRMGSNQTQVKSKAPCSPAYTATTTPVVPSSRNKARMASPSLQAQDTSITPDVSVPKKRTRTTALPSPTQTDSDTPAVSPPQKKARAMAPSPPAQPATPATPVLEVPASNVTVAIPTPNSVMRALRDDMLEVYDRQEVQISEKDRQIARLRGEIIKVTTSHNEAAARHTDDIAKKDERIQRLQSRIDPLMEELTQKDNSMVQLHEEVSQKNEQLMSANQSWADEVAELKRQNAKLEDDNAGRRAINHHQWRRHEQDKKYRERCRQEAERWEQERQNQLQAQLRQEQQHYKQRQGDYQRHRNQQRHMYKQCQRSHPRQASQRPENGQEHLQWPPRRPWTHSTIMKARGASGMR